jgi:Sap, sulfolipid-1-addressing protein
LDRYLLGVMANGTGVALIAGAPFVVQLKTRSYEARSMGSDLRDVFLLSLVAMFNPALLAAVTVMLLLPRPKRLMLGYLLGPDKTSITAGVLIMFSLHGSGAERTSKRTIGPLEDIVAGLLVLAIAWVVRSGRDRPFQSRRRRKKDAKVKARKEAGRPTESLSFRTQQWRSTGHVRRRRDADLSGGRLPGRAGSHPQAQFGTHRGCAADSVLLPDAADLSRGAAARLRIRAASNATGGSRVQVLVGTERPDGCGDRRLRDRGTADRQGA